MTHRRCVTLLVGFLMAAAVCSSNLMAQLSVSTIRGTAMDQSGAVVPNVSISLVNLGTNLKWSVKTNSDGDYEIPDLLHGTYRLTATAPGFQSFIANNIILTPQETRRIDIHLKLGAASTKVTVNASAAVINTESAKIQENYTHRVIQNAPLIGDARNQLIFLTTLPQIQYAGSIYGIEMAGQSGNQLQESMNGMPTGDGSINQMAGIDVTQDVTVDAVNNSAQYARIGTYNVTTKSGTNHWHGSAYWWYENSALNARDFFAAQKPVSKVDTMHAGLGGPIIKNNTFFYGSWGGQRYPGGSSYLTTVPTALMRTGDFSQLLNLSSPIVIKDPLTGLPFPGNIIPASLLNATSVATLSNYVPPPNIGGPNALSNNYFFQWPHPTDLLSGNWYDGRIDHQFSQKNRFWGQYMWNNVDYALAGNYQPLGWTRIRNNRMLTLQDTDIVSPTLVNTFRFGLYWNILDDGSTVAGFTPLKGENVVKGIGLQGVNPNNYIAQGFPEMDIAGYPSIVIGDSGGGNLQDYKNWDYADSLTWAKGRHILQFGIDFRKFNSFSDLIPNTIYGTYGFDGSSSGYGYSDFLLGLPHTSSINPNPLLNLTQLNNEIGPYVQDTFKVNSRLTLDLGVRWDKFGAASYSNGLIYNWNPTTGDVVVPPDAINKVSPLYPSTIKVVAGPTKERPALDNIAPRLGVAYRIRKNTVIRAGYGIYTEALGDFARAQTGGPYSLTETFFNSITGGTPLFSFPDPFPPTGVIGTVPSQSVSGYPLDTSNGRIHQFNITIAHQVKNMGFRLSYVGSRGRGLSYSITDNIPRPSVTPFSPGRNPFPQFVGATYVRTNGKTNYNALVFDVKRKVGEVTFDGNWTWASNLNDMEDLEDPYAPLGWANDPYTARHQVTINAVWTIPIGRGRQFLSNARGVENQILGGWGLYFITYFATGQWYSPSFSGSDPSNTNTFSGLPDRICNGNLPSGQRSVGHWFNPSCFVVPAPGTFGNASPYSLEGPGMNAQDLTIAKTFDATEWLHVDFSGSLENMFNHPNFSNPTADVSAPTAGVISSDRSYIGPRTVMFRLKLQF